MQEDYYPGIGRKGTERMWNVVVESKFAYFLW